MLQKPEVTSQMIVELIQEHFSMEKINYWFSKTIKIVLYCKIYGYVGMTCY